MDVKPYTAAARLSSFLPLPKALLTADLSGTALLLYALLLDRGTLSAKNGYTGRGGQVYVVYPIQKLAAALGPSEGAGAGGAHPSDAPGAGESQPYFFIPARGRKTGGG